ncbi:hypothetical protein B0H11DRAFT_178953 [Mycena galericulata]|nr:hypothetical protein B0H11DRAFT_178953 [Mycena galericulata]
MDNDATLANSPLQTRQKRVLPSRSRRGGPGVGNCEVDNMILNAQLHKSENEPLIPADTMFVLKTNDMLEQVASQLASAEGSGLNLRAHESYFDRPDVLKAYREQTIIETPQYEGVSDTASVGGRLRQRSVEENNSDIDAVYEKRHRKYEAFEKRQRLREKEKLKHEQYKLKERIEQLRGMDNSAFLAAPASSFSPRPGGAAEVFEEDTLLAALGGLGGPNGSPAYQEGERRRKEMLKNAQALEERYRVLLPPERPRKPAGVNVSTDAESELSAKEVSGLMVMRGRSPKKSILLLYRKKSLRKSNSKSPLAPVSPRPPRFRRAPLRRRSAAAAYHLHSIPRPHHFHLPLGNPGLYWRHRQ